MQKNKYQLGKIIGITFIVLGSMFFLIMLTSTNGEKSEFINDLLGGLA